jgi:hypothetical protein
MAGSGTALVGGSVLVSRPVGGIRKRLLEECQVSGVKTPFALGEQGLFLSPDNWDSRGFTVVPRRIRAGQGCTIGRRLVESPICLAPSEAATADPLLPGLHHFLGVDIKFSTNPPKLHRVDDALATLNL